MGRRKVRFSIDDSDDVWILLRKLLEEWKKHKPRRRFTKWTKLGTLADQNYLCKICYTYLDFPEYDHIDDDRSNNSYKNCQALCLDCHRKKTQKIKQRKLKLSQALRFLRKKLL